MRKTLTIIVAAALFGVLAAVVVAQTGQDAAPAGTTGTTETVPDRTTTVEDNPARMGTGAAPTVDISGPCDEAEHASDPRCTGAAVGAHRGDDDRGRDGGDDRGERSGHHDGDDRDDHDGDDDGSSGRGDGYD